MGDEDDEARRRGLEEAAAAFSHEVTLETYTAVHDEVLRRFDYRCAITGALFEPSSVRSDESLKLIAIRPRELGGLLHASNYLPLCSDAARAFEQGHLIIGADFEIWADLYRLDPEFQLRIAPLGKLVLPEDSALWPDPAALRWHREQVLGVVRETA